MSQFKFSFLLTAKFIYQIAYLLLIKLHMKEIVDDEKKARETRIRTANSIYILFL